MKLNKGFIKLSVLFAGVLALVGVAGYLVSAKNAEAIDRGEHVNNSIVRYEVGECGETLFKGQAQVRTPMYLVVMVDGNAQSVLLPTEGRGQISVGPFDHDTTIYWRVFGGPERDYDDPLWTGYVPGSGPWTDSIKAYIKANGEEWTTNGDENPFTTWHSFEVEGCPEVCGDEEALNYGGENGEVDENEVINDKLCEYEPEPTPTPEQPRGTTPAGAPQCTDSKPLILPSNVHVIRNGSDATVNFFTQSSSANIYYRTSGQPEWQHALRDVPVTGGYVSVTIRDLDPVGDYDFGIQSANSCAGGEVVLAVVVDDYQPRTFMFTHWEWLK